MFFFAFAGHVIFGTTLFQFSTPGVAFETLFNLVLGDTEISGELMYHFGVAGSVYYFTFLFMYFPVFFSSIYIRVFSHDFPRFYIIIKYLYNLCI